MNLFRSLGLPFWSILIAIVLWVQVHGQGVGSVRMDVALQVRDVPTDMVIVNDLPEQVSITVSGLQSQLNSLDAKVLFVSVDASSLNMPGVIEQALNIEAVDLPVGLKVERIQPDSVQLQVDHIVTRSLNVIPVFDLPQGWKVDHVVVGPAEMKFSGPEIWLSSLNKIETVAIRLDLNQGLFDVETLLTPLSGQGIHILDKDVVIRVRGELTWTPTVDSVEPEPEISSASIEDAMIEETTDEEKIVELEKAESKGAEATEAEAGLTGDGKGDIEERLSPLVDVYQENIEEVEGL